MCKRTITINGGYNDVFSFSWLDFLKTIILLNNIILYMTTLSVDTWCTNSGKPNPSYEFFLTI